MEEELCSAFDAFSSSDNETRQSAEKYLIEQIDNNQELYIPLFNIGITSTNSNHLRLALIILSNIVRKRFDYVSQVLPDFTEKLGLLISNPIQKGFHEFHVEIVFSIAFRNKDPWNDLPAFLSLYQENPELQVFCVYLYTRCFHDDSVYKKYAQVFRPLDQEITLIGLQHDDPKVQIRSTNHFTKLFSKVRSPEIFEQYQEHYQLICQIAVNSFEKMDEYNFSLFWSQFYRLPIQYLDPLFDIALNFLETKEISQNCQIKLLQVLISDYVKIGPENLETVIDAYFSSLETTDDVDSEDRIFRNLAKVDFNQSYELFKSKLFTFLTNNELEKQQIGLIMFDGFVKAYMNRIGGDISDIIDISLKIAQNSVDISLKIEPNSEKNMAKYLEDSFKYMAKYLVNYL